MSPTLERVSYTLTILAWLIAFWIAGCSPVRNDLVTGLDVSCLVPAKYLGRPDEVWLACALPLPSAEFCNSIVITAPYIIVRPRAPGWYAFLERTLPKLKCSTHTKPTIG